jgi:hypothetical protein
MQNTSSIYSWRESNIVSGIRRIWIEERYKGLCRGLSATILRELLYSSIRMGAYEPILHAMSNDTDVPSPTSKYVSALISGGIGAAIANPTDLVKVKFQSETLEEKLPFQSTIGGFRYIYAKEGLRGLYRGSIPTILRAAILTSAQLGSYDTIKNNILKSYFNMSDGYGLYLGTSLIAGLITTTASNPGSNLFVYVLIDND